MGVKVFGRIMNAVNCCLLTKKATTLCMGNGLCIKTSLSFLPWTFDPAISGGINICEIALYYFGRWRQGKNEPYSLIF